MGPEKKMRDTYSVAIFPGSFDPVHYGHLDVVETASELFSKVIWAIGVNPLKKPMFSLEQRLEMMRLANKFPNVSVASFSGLLVRFAQSQEAGVIVRSLRMVAADFEYEFQMTLVNRKLVGELKTIYIPAGQEHMHMNSTIVRELILSGEDVEGYLPPEVLMFIRGQNIHTRIRLS